jgi:hypothetical protein
MLRITIASILLLSFTVTGELIAQELKESKAHKLFGEDGVYISMSAGVVFDHMQSSGYLIDHLKFNKSRQPFLSAKLDFDLEDMSEREIKGLILRLEAQYKRVHFHGSGDANNDRYDEYELKANTCMPVVSILYRVPWRWKLRPYAGIGGGMVWSNVSKNTLTINYNKPYYSSPIVVDERPWEIADDDYVAMYTAGLMYGNRLDMNLTFAKSRWSRDDDPHHQLRNRTISLSFGYRL